MKPSITLDLETTWNPLLKQLNDIDASVLSTGQDLVMDKMAVGYSTHAQRLEGDWDGEKRGIMKWMGRGVIGKFMKQKKVPRLPI